jgi:hypothetical protein
VEHPFLVIKRIFGFTKVRYRSLEKNATRLLLTCARANVYLASDDWQASRRDRCVRCATRRSKSDIRGVEKRCNSPFRGTALNTETKPNEYFISIVD